MANYNYLKVDFYGQFDNDTIHKLCYPEPYNRANAAAVAWLNPIKDYRNSMRTLFPTANNCYKIHLDNNGVYYSMLFRNADDTRGGYVMITTMIALNYVKLIDGEAILTLLNLLKRKVVDAKNFTPAAVEECLVASGMPQQQTAMPLIKPISGGSTSLAYRTYASNDELIALFQFPRQADYMRFADVFFVPKQWTPQAGASIQPLTTPIKRTYIVMKPAGVQVQGKAETNGQLVVTYSKPGFKPLSVTLPVNGVNSQYVKYNKGTLTILEPDNLPFRQQVSLLVKVNNRSYSDQKVTAQIGSVPLKYANGSYSAELTPAQLAGAEVKMSVIVNDPGLVTKSTTDWSNVRTVYQTEEYPVWKKVLWPLITLILGALLTAGACILFKDTFFPVDQTVIDDQRGNQDNEIIEEAENTDFEAGIDEGYGEDVPRMDRGNASQQEAERQAIEQAGRDVEQAGQAAERANQQGGQRNQGAAGTTPATRTNPATSSPRQSSATTSGTSSRSETHAPSTSNKKDTKSTNKSSSKPSAAASSSSSTPTSVTNTEVRQQKQNEER